MSEALVSCIMPTWNGERYLSQALDSVFAQTYRPIEVIVVDDGSTDGTRAVVEQDSRPIQLLSQPNSGPVVARNTGIQHANGDFVAFLDHDDVWVPEKLAWQVSAFAGREIGACVGHLQEFYSDQFGVEHDRGEPVIGYITGTLMLSRSALELVGPLNPQLGHADTADWILRARHSGVGEAALPQVLLRRRRHEGNRSQVLNRQVRNEFLHVLKANVARNRAAKP
jgi:glycosyltransferase involved in cell wall biosynthesis